MNIESKKNNIDFILKELIKKDKTDWFFLKSVLNKYPKNNKGIYSKQEILNYLKNEIKKGIIKISVKKQQELENLLLTKPTRTHSGIATVSILTKPFPCPGRCIFCPNDVRMPKSYISSEPGAQRAERNYFDPYLQTYRRLQALHTIGHSLAKVEIIILGGTWSFYPEKYQIWFIKEIFLAINDFSEGKNETEKIEILAKKLAIDSNITTKTLSKIKNIDLNLEQKIDSKQNNLQLKPNSTLFDEVNSQNSSKENALIISKKIPTTYNQVVSQLNKIREEKIKSEKNMENWEKATWEELIIEHQKNVISNCKVVGLVLETRPDHISPEEIIRMRKLGCTKIQIGFQSLNDKVLEMNQRGHKVEQTYLAVDLIRSFGFKIHAHWMANLYGSTPKEDIKDYQKMFSNSHLKPDELKIYPCSLVETAKLVDYYKDGLWKPYSSEELKFVLESILPITPEYCRLTRIIRDIPGTEILVGNKVTNLRQIIEQELAKKKIKLRDIRSREIKTKTFLYSDLKLKYTKYLTTNGLEIFLQYVTKENFICGFLRLSLPNFFDKNIQIKDLLANKLKTFKPKNTPEFKHKYLDELDYSAIIREVHIYGKVVDYDYTKNNQKLPKIQDKAQHLGLGTKLLDKAKLISYKLGYLQIAVISAIGTREYYQKRGFELKQLYQIHVFK